MSSGRMTKRAPDRETAGWQTGKKNSVLDRLEHVIMELQLEFDRKLLLKKFNWASNKLILKKLGTLVQNNKPEDI